MAWLWLVDGPGAPNLFWLPASGAVIGKEIGCDVRFDDPVVSKRHARIQDTGDAYVLTDLESRNGTKVGGRSLQPHQPERIDNEGEFTIVRDKYRFVLRRADPVRVVDPEDSSHTKTIDASSSSVISNVTLHSEDKLRTLISVVETLRDTSVRADTSLMVVLGDLLDRLFRIFPAANKGLCLVQEASVGPRPLVAYRYGPRDLAPCAPSIRRDILSAVRAGQAVCGDGGRVIATPLTSRDGQAFGYLQLSSRRLTVGDEFTTEHRDVLVMVGHLVAFAIENHLFYRATLQTQGLRREMELAWEIQRKLLPAATPTIPGYEFFSDYRPAKYVGGDYYDFLSLPDGRLAIALGDVAGKGVAAGILVSKVASELGILLEAGQSAQFAVDRVNSRMMERGVDSAFVTLCVLILDPRTHEVEVVNAGHMPPLWRHADGTVSDAGADVVGLPVGVLSGQEYRPARIKLQPGDSLTLYTDGISEARNPAGTFYDVGRTRRLHLQVAAPAADADELGRHILDDLERFVDGTPQSDDICLICLRREA